MIDRKSIALSLGLCLITSSASVAASNQMYRGLGLLLPRVSVGGEFDDSILLSSSTAAIDVPSVSDFTGVGLSWAGHELPNSGFAGGAEIGGYRGSSSAPGVLAPPGGYGTSYWNIYMDLIPAVWVPMAGGENPPVSVALVGRAGVGYQRLTIDDSGTRGSGLLDAGYSGFRLRYGGGVRARVGARTAKPLIVSVEWVKNRGSYGSVNLGGEKIELQDKLDGATTEILFSVAFLFSTPDAP